MADKEGMLMLQGLATEKLHQRLFKLSPTEILSLKDFKIRGRMSIDMSTSVEPWKTTGIQLAHPKPAQRWLIDCGSPDAAEEWKSAIQAAIAAVDAEEGADESSESSSESTDSSKGDDDENSSAQEDTLAELKQLLIQERYVHKRTEAALRTQNEQYDKEEKSLINTLDANKDETELLKDLRNEIKARKEAEAQLAALEGDAKDAGSSRKALKKQLDKVTKALKKAKESHAQIKAENMHLVNLGTEDASASARRFVEIEKQRDTAQAKAKKVKAELTQLQRELKTAGKVLVKTESEIEAKEEQLQKHRERVTKMKDEFAQKEKDLIEKMKREAATGTEVQKKDRLLKRSQARVESLEREVEKYKTNLIKAREHFEASEARVKAAEAKNVASPELEKELKELRQNKITMQEKIGRLVPAYKELAAEKQKLEKTLQSSDTGEQEKMIAKLKEGAMKLIKENKTLKIDLNSLKDEMPTEAQRLEREAEIGRLREKAAEAERLRAQNEELRAAVASGSDANEVISKADDEALKKLQEELELERNLRTNVSAQCKKLEDQMSALTLTQEAAESTAQQKQSQLKKARTIIQQLTAELKKKAPADAEDPGVISQLKERIVELEADKAAAEKESIEKQAEVEEVRKRAEEAEKLRREAELATMAAEQAEADAVENARRAKAQIQKEAEAAHREAQEAKKQAEIAAEKAAAEAKRAKEEADAAAKEAAKRAKEEADAAAKEAAKRAKEEADAAAKEAAKRAKEEAEQAAKKASEQALKEAEEATKKAEREAAEAVRKAQEEADQAEQARKAAEKAAEEIAARAKEDAEAAAKAQKDATAAAAEATKKTYKDYLDKASKKLYNTNIRAARKHETDGEWASAIKSYSAALALTPEGTNPKLAAKCKKLKKKL